MFTNLSDSITLPILSLLAVTTLVAGRGFGEDLSLTLQSQESPDGGKSWTQRTQSQTWVAAETAVIVCDVWDRHHCLNAVRRLEEFAPRMNEVLKEARRRGVTIIHAPSDCMSSYEGHPARERAVSVPLDPSTPADIKYWCSRIPSEELAVYPIDQSDGGEDDDPAEHARWAAELTAFGRNPAMPWKLESPLIEIDEDHDYISDRGDEVWSILKANAINNVILLGVHTNMCVLGRPFGLRRMARGGKNVVLMRDMTDCMYNPKRWPFVDHFTGNDLIVSHVERFICPTISSEQILGGVAFRSKYDHRTAGRATQIPAAPRSAEDYGRQWTTGVPGETWDAATHGAIVRNGDVVWLRCTVRLSSEWISRAEPQLVLAEQNGMLKAWMNGMPLVQASVDNPARLTVSPDSIYQDDINLLVMRFTPEHASTFVPLPPSICCGSQTLSLKGRWQFRVGDDSSWSSIPLPAKFGMGSDVLFESP